MSQKPKSRFGFPLKLAALLVVAAGVLFYIAKPDNSGVDSTGPVLRTDDGKVLSFTLQAPPQAYLDELAAGNTAHLADIKKLYAEQAAVWDKVWQEAEKKLHSPGDEEGFTQFKNLAYEVYKRNKAVISKFDGGALSDSFAQELDQAVLPQAYRFLSSDLDNVLTTYSNNLRTTSSQFDDFNSSFYLDQLLAAQVSDLENHPLLQQVKDLKQYLTPEEYTKAAWYLGSAAVRSAPLANALFKQAGNYHLSLLGKDANFKAAFGPVGERQYIGPNAPEDKVSFTSNLQRQLILLFIRSLATSKEPNLYNLYALSQVTKYPKACEVSDQQKAQACVLKELQNLVPNSQALLTLTSQRTTINVMTNLAQQVEEGKLSPQEAAKLMQQELELVH